MSIDTGVYKYLDCSTGHITLEDNTFLAAFGYDNGNREPIVVVPHGYGYWVHALHHEDDIEGSIATLSEPLKAVFRKAHDEDCVWVNLDADGFMHEDLEIYEW